MSAQTNKIESAQRPASELVRMLADGLGSVGFAILDVKETALLVEAGRMKFMIGIQGCERTMGGLREQIGRITIESRRESFYVHADYVDTDLARQWETYPHPEFANEDLDDLIAALEELRANPRRVSAE